MRGCSRSPNYLTLAFLCLTAPSAHAADADVVRAAVDRTIRPLMAQHKVPGMSVAVTVDGQAMFFNYGVASLAGKAPVSEHTVFELGSISKVFTATLALYAQDLGKLSLGDHPGTYAPQLKGSAVDQANLLELGTYTAGGLPLQFPEGVEDGRQVVSYLRQWKPDAAPGIQRRYSNPSIGLLGHVTALSLKTDFADAIEQQLLPALGLRETYVRVPDSAMASYAWGYDRKDQPARVNRAAFDYEAYGVKSTAADMIHFVQLNIDLRQLRGPVRRAVEGTQIGYFEVGGMVQGLGWEQYKAPATLQQLLDGNAESMIWAANPARKLTSPQGAPPGTYFNKTGSTRGFGAYAAFVPDRKIGVVMLANKNYPIPARVEAAHAILAQLVPLLQNKGTN